MKWSLVNRKLDLKCTNKGSTNREVLFEDYPRVDINAWTSQYNGILKI